MMKKTLSIIVAITMAASLIAGCAGSAEPTATETTNETAEAATEAVDESAPSDAGTTETASADTGDASKTLTVWTWDPAFNIYAMQEAEKIYKQTDPEFNLEIVEVGWDDIERNLGTILGANDLSSLPDIFLVQDYAFQKYGITYPELFTDLTDSAIDFSQFSAGKVSESTVNGRNLGIPFDAGTEVACYRTDILEQAGYTVDDLTDIDWNRFEEIGEDVLAKTGYSLISVQANSADILLQMVQSAGGNIWNEDGTPNFVGNEVLEKAMNTYKTMFESGVMATGNSWDEYIATFTSGKTLGAMNGCWILASVQSDETQSGLWRLTNMPKLPDVEGATNYSNQGGSTWVITSNCKNKDLAIDFFNKTFAGSTEFYDTILPSAAAISTWIPAGSSDVYAQPMEFFGGDSIYAKISEFGSKIPAFERGVYYTNANTALATAVTNVCAGADIESELQAAEETVNFEMSE